MGDPELHSDEKILLTTQNVFVKSIPFEAILTNKRIILVDRKKNLIPPKDILLATIRDIEGGENAIRDQIITLSLITSTGETRQLVLTFSRTAGGGRKRERDEWLRTLKDQTSSSIQKAIRKVVPSFDEEIMTRPMEQATPKIEITNRPAAKKEIEGAQPMKKIVETGNVPPKPVETSSLPTGSFCNRCGNRIPQGSLFCNRCGARVPGAEKDTVVSEPAVPQVIVESPGTAVPPPAFERKERPVEKEIQSIEPLIEGSVPRTIEAAPVEPSRSAERMPEPTAAAESSIAQAAQSIIDSAAPKRETDAVSPDEGSSTGPQEGVRNRSILPEIFSQKGAPVPPTSGASGTPPPAGGSGPRRGVLVTVAVALIIIIALAGGAFIYWNFLKGTGPETGDGTETTTEPTTIPPTLTTTAPVTLRTTIVPATTAAPAQVQLLIPESGVWVHVKYPNTFKGTVGTAGDQYSVTDAGEKFYSISTAEGIVEASIQKTDGSGDELVVEIYKDGALVKRGTTTVPKGAVDMQADLKPPTTATTKPTTVATTIPAGNVTTVTTTTAATNVTTSP